MMIRQLFLLLAILIFAFAGCTKSGPQIVKVALVAPLTGDISAHGQGMKRAAQMAIDEANAAKRFPQYQLQFAAFDDRGDPKEAVTVANQIISDPTIIGVVGHLNSGCSIPASQVYAKKNVLMITPASTNPKLTQQGLKSVFRLCTTDDVQGPFAADFVIDSLALKKIAVIHDKTAYGLGLAEQFRNRFESRAEPVLSFDGIDVGEKDYKALITKIKSTNPDLIYFGGMHPECGLITKQAKELGLAIPVFAGDGVLTPEYITIGGPATEGDMSSMTGLPPEKLPAAQKFIDDYKRLYPNDDLQPYDPYTYEAVMIILEALAEVGTDRDSLIQAVARIDYKGILGESSFDEIGDTRNKTITIYRVTNGKFVYVD